MDRLTSIGSRRLHFIEGTTPAQIEMIARAAFENGAPLSIQLSMERLKRHPQADAIMAVFKKYEDLKFKEQSP